MKKIAMILSLVTLVLAFTVSTVSAQKATGTQKATTEKVSTEKSAPAAKACCADKKAGEKKACCADKGGKAGCSKSCSEKEKAACKHEKEAKTTPEAAPVPKKN
ncbi:MAG: hypothetical protein HXX13_09835 [Bacteroidetes bacterium]|nr:hypothetical protein [Bacteroidota bacterium]